MAWKKVDKQSMEVVKPGGGLRFVETLGKRSVSIYVEKLNEALNISGAIKIAKNDFYLKAQLRIAAKKLKLRLVYALEGDFIFVKPLVIEGEQKRLMLYLREPRAESELEAMKLELHLKNELARLAREGLAHLFKGKWVLTAQGLDSL